jgi:hypothetical protein
MIGSKCDEDTPGRFLECQSLIERLQVVRRQMLQPILKACGIYVA